MSEDKKTSIAIVAVGVVIAGIILISNFTPGSKKENPNTQAPANIQVRKIQDDDLVLGNRKADLIIFEYSDTECPYCKLFHGALNKVVKKYKNEVAWVYRHFPLEQLHPKAKTEAMAVECAVKIAGPEKGFAYLNRLMEITPSNNGLDLKELPNIAKFAGVDIAKFNKCLNNKETEKDVDEDLEEAIKNGARGTPFSIIIYKNKPVVLPGAMSYEKLDTIISEILKSDK